MTKGVTLPEILVVIALFVVLLAVFIPLTKKKQYEDPGPSYVIRCIEGTKWIEDATGKMTQMLNADNKSIECSKY